MKKKIIGIIVCMLLISCPVLSVTGTINTKLLDETSDENSYFLEQIIRISGVQSDWSEEKLTASDAASDDNFGSAVSIDGDYAIVGAFGDDSYTGSAYVFKRSGTTWTQEQKLTASDGTSGDNFGCAVSIDGDYVIIGACYSNSNIGSAYVFKRSGTTWSQEQKLTASDGEAWDYFGYTVSIDGEYAIIGAFQDDSKGSAYVFKRSGTTWSQEQKLTASDGSINDEFGNSVSIDGEYAVVGAYRDDFLTGSAYVFKREGTTWTEQQKLTASDGATSDRFGNSVSIDGEYTLIGMPRDDSMKGSAYVFQRSGTTWTEQQKLTASDGEASDLFGISVSIDGLYTLISAMGDDSDQGSAYVFKRSGTTWSQEQKLTASDAAASDYFGESVSIQGENAVIGAPDDDDNGASSGSAYVFRRPVPDLDCVGSLSWDSVSPGETVTDDFVLANVGDSSSELSWEIESYPSWGNWTFIPSSGTGLTPEMGSITIYVEVVAPDQQNQEFTGDIKVINSEDENDYDIIPVNLKTPRNKIMYNNLLLQLLESNPLLFPILRYLIGH